MIRKRNKTRRVRGKKRPAMNTYEAFLQYREGILGRYFDEKKSIEKLAPKNNRRRRFINRLRVEGLL